MENDEQSYERERVWFCASVGCHQVCRWHSNKSVVNNDPQGYPNRVRQQRATGIWVYERYPAVDGALPYTIDSKTGKLSGNIR